MTTLARLIATLALTLTTLFTLGVSPATPEGVGNFHDGVRLDISQVELGAPCTCP